MFFLTDVAVNRAKPLLFLVALLVPPSRAPLGRRETSDPPRAPSVAPTAATRSEAGGAEM